MRNLFFAVVVAAAALWALPVGAQTLGQSLPDCGGRSGGVSKTCVVLCTGGSCVADYFDLHTQTAHSGRGATPIVALGRYFSIRLEDNLTGCSSGTVSVFDSETDGGQKALIAGTLDPVIGGGVSARTLVAPPGRFISVTDASVGCSSPLLVLLVVQRLAGDR